METESEVLVTGEGGKITTITQVQKLLKKSTDQSCAPFFFLLIIIIINKKIQHLKSGSASRGGACAGRSTVASDTCKPDSRAGYHETGIQRIIMLIKMMIKMMMMMMMMILANQIQGGDIMRQVYKES